VTKPQLSQKITSKLLRSSVDAAVEAGDLLKRNMYKDRSVTYKGKINLVTEMDVRSEKLIIGRLCKALPKSSFLAEEGGANDNDSEFRWIIDPLDGTTNYAHSFPVWCVSIALEYQGEIVLGCVYDPTRNELFTASYASPARLNGKKITVSRCDKLDRALLATGFPYDIRTSSVDNLKNFANFAKSAQAIRRAGSAALDLCYVAVGRFDGFWELKLHPWDTAAASLIVVQAGGKTSSFEGNPYKIYDNRLLASNGKIHREMMEVLSLEHRPKQLK
jgi:myo-inositol-1(or 4)-monophosphatase